MVKNMIDMKELKDKVIKKIFIDNMSEFLIFVTDSDEEIVYKTFVTNGEIVCKTEDDCCAATYISEVIGINNIYNGYDNYNGRKVIEIEELSLGTCEKSMTYTVDNIYAYKLKFEPKERGDTFYACKPKFEPEFGYNTTVHLEICDYLLVIFRNGSDGYYGGSLELSNRNEIPENRKITELTENYYGD